MARISIENFAFSDVRFDRIADALKMSRNCVLGTMCTVWHHCTQRESYFITEEDFKLIIPVPGFFEAALDVGLLKKEGDKIYVSGTRGRIEWLKSIRERSRKKWEESRLNFKNQRISNRQTEGLVG